LPSAEEYLLPEVGGPLVQLQHLSMLAAGDARGFELEAEGYLPGLADEESVREIVHGDDRVHRAWWCGGGASGCDDLKRGSAIRPRKQLCDLHDLREMLGKSCGCLLGLLVWAWCERVVVLLVVFKLRIGLAKGELEQFRARTASLCNTRVTPSSHAS
jgi:hypothetical protein